MARIERLTAAQELRLTEFRAEYLAHGLSTAAADRPRAEAAFARAYRRIGRDPVPVIWVDSPLTASLAVALLRNDASLGASIRASLRDSLRASQIAAEYTYWWGSQDLHWIAHYRFCSEIGVQYAADALDGLDIMHEIGLSCSWWYPRNGVIIACERPEIVRMDDRQRLHCESGPAVRHRDGWETYAIHGVRVPERIVNDPASITVSEIDSEPNAEIRRVMMERFGTARYVQESGAELIADDPVHGRLFRKRRNDDTDIVMLHVKCPTTEPDGTVREFWLRVHPECRPMRVNADGTMWVGDRQALTPMNARASTFGLTGDVFEHLADAA